MSERRLFSTKITESDAFLDMPLSSQALYFHLCLNADDDGVVAAPRKIMRMVNAQPDDLNVLAAKRFILHLKESVIVIKHWYTHNTLKKDRYRVSQYAGLLEGLYLNANGDYTDDPNTAVTDWKPYGTKLEPRWNQSGTISQVKSSQDKLSKDNISSSIIDNLNDEEYRSLTERIDDEDMVTLLDKLGMVEANVKHPYKYCLTVAKNLGILRGEK